MALILSANNTAISKQDIDITSPTIFMIGGNLCVNLEKVIKAENVCRTLMRGCASKAQIVSVGYQNEILDRFGFNESNDADFDVFFEEVLLGAICNKDGSLKSTQEMINGIKNIVLFSHCAGSCVVNYFVDKFDNILEKNGVDETERCNVLKNLFVLSYSPYNEIRDSVTSVNLCPIREAISEDHWDYQLNKMYRSFPRVGVYAYPDYLFEPYFYNIDAKGDFIQDILADHRFAYSYKGSKFVILLNALTDKSQQGIADDHSIVSLVYATTHPDVNPKTLSYASKMSNFTSGLLINSQFSEDFSEDIKKQLKNMESEILDTQNCPTEVVY